MIVVTGTAVQTITAVGAQSADGLEIGGILLGHDHGDRLTITVAGDPGPRAERHPDRFLRDLQHAQHLADQAYDLDASVWIGEWHTHPGGPTSPSPLDVDTYRRLLADESLAFDRIASLIITPCQEHGWACLTAHGWIVTPDRVEVADVVAQGARDE